MKTSKQNTVISYRHGPIRFLTLFLVCFIVFGVQYSFDIPQAIEESLENKLEISETQFNLLYSVFAGASVLTALFFGFLIDKIGCKVMLISLAISVALFEYIIAIGGFVESYSLILAGRILLGLVCESLISVQLTIVTKWFRGKQLSLAMGLALTSPELGDALNSWVSPKIEQASGSLGYPILVSALICTLGVVAALVVAYIEQKAQQSDSAKNIEYFSARSSYEEEQEIDQSINCKDIQYFKFPFWLLCFISTLELAVYVPFLDNGNRLLQKRFCYSQSEAGQIVMSTYLIAACFSPLLGMIVDRLGQKRIFIFGSSGIFIAAHAIIMLWPQCHFEIVQAGVVSGYILLGLGYCFYANCIAPAIPLMVHQKYTGTAFGILLMLENTALAIFPIISGAIVGGTSSPQVGYRKSQIFFFSVSALSFIACFGLFFIGSHYTKKLDATKNELENMKIIRKGVQIQITCSQAQQSINNLSNQKITDKLLENNS